MKAMKEKFDGEREGQLKKYKDRLQMDLEFKAFQKYGIFIPYL